MQELDAALRQAAPEPVDGDSPAGRSARALAADIAARHPMRRSRWGIAPAVIGAVVLAGGATAAAAPALFDWSWGSADAISVQEFPVGADDSGRRCVMALWAEAADPADPLDSAVARAQKFLGDQDWSTLDDDADDIWAKQRLAVIAGGSATPELLASLTAAQVGGDLEAAGLMVPGMSLATRIDCSDGAGAGE